MDLALCAGRLRAPPGGFVDTINTPTRAGAGAYALGLCTPKREDGSIAKGRSVLPTSISKLPSDEIGCVQDLPLACKSLRKMKIGLGGDMLALIMAPGDVLFVRSCRSYGGGDESPSALGLPGFGCLTRPGTVGDWTDHVLLVAGPPCGVWRNSPEATDLKDVWPAVSAVNQGAEIWRVNTIDSSVRGLHIAESLLYVDRATGQLMLVGEIDPEDGELYVSERPEPVELWQSPAELRAQIRLDFVEEVLADMKAGETDWSPSSAACAIIESIEMTGFEDSHTLDDVQACWMQDPICTCAVIGFWQRYLCKVAEARSPRGSAECAETAMALIRRWMPLRCDRAMPGDLVSSMQNAGWILVSQIPRISLPVLLPGQHKQPVSVKQPISVSASFAPARRENTMECAGIQPEVANSELLYAVDDEPPESCVASERSKGGSSPRLLPHTAQDDLQGSTACNGERSAETAKGKEALLPAFNCRSPSPPRGWMPSTSDYADYSTPSCDPAPVVLECSLRPRPGSNALRGIVAL